MYALLITIVAILFAAMLFVNLYFRARVLKAYRQLVQNRVEFEIQHIFNRERREAEIHPRYPHMVKEIEAFSDNLRRSIRMATILLALITLFGGILMYYR